MHHHPLAVPIIVDHFLSKNICILSICIWPAILDNTVVITVVFIICSARTASGSTKV